MKIGCWILFLFFSVRCLPHQHRYRSSSMRSLLPVLVVFCRMVTGDVFRFKEGESIRFFVNSFVKEILLIKASNANPENSASLSWSGYGFFADKRNATFAYANVNKNIQNRIGISNTFVSIVNITSKDSGLYNMYAADYTYRWVVAKSMHVSVGDYAALYNQPRARSPSQCKKGLLFTIPLPERLKNIERILFTTDNYNKQRFVGLRKRHQSFLFYNSDVYLKSKIFLNDTQIGLKDVTCSDVGLYTLTVVNAQGKISVREFNFNCDANAGEQNIYAAVIVLACFALLVFATAVSCSFLHKVRMMNILAYVEYMRTRCYYNA